MGPPMINPKAHERVIFGFSAALLLCLLLALPLAASELTNGYLRLARIATALALTGLVILFPGFFKEWIIKPWLRILGAILVFAIFYLFSPLSLFIEEADQSARAVLYCHIGKVSDTRGKDISYLYEMPINEALKRHGANPPDSRLIAFTSPESALYKARELLAELQGLVKDAYFEQLRLGLGYGLVKTKDGLTQGRAVTNAINVAKSSSLSNVGLGTGIFLSKEFAARVKESVRQEYSIIQVSSKDSAEPIYSASLAYRQSDSTARRQVSHELSAYDDVYIVCAALSLVGSKRETSKEQADRRLRWIADTQLAPVLTAINEFEGFFPGDLNYLLLPDPAAALRASEQLLKSSRNSASWDEQLSVKLYVSIHRGAVSLTEATYYGTAIETSAQLTRESLAGEGIALSPEAHAGLVRLLEPSALTPGERSETGKFYLYRPKLND
jgi:hypothetical protein